jgi:four helix bundle protein
VIGDQIDWELLDDDVYVVAEKRAAYGEQKPKTYRDLKVWQEGMNLVEACYKQSQSYPADETYGLRSQIRRAAVSVVCNIAEGWGRDSAGEFDHALSFSGGSLREIETQVLVAQRFSFGDQDMIPGILAKCDAVGRMIFRLREVVQKRRKKPT